MRYALAIMRNRNPGSTLTARTAEGLHSRAFALHNIHEFLHELVQLLILYRRGRTSD